MDYARKYLSDTQLNSDSRPSSRPVVTAADPPEAVEVESDFVIILAALLCALICVVGLIAVARCAWLRRGVSGGGAGGAHRTANKGLKKKVLNSLPKYTYKSDCKKVAAVTAEVAAAEVVVEVEDCAICLTEYADGDEIRVLPHCGHRFHVLCIDTWLGSHSSCPSCRRVLVESRCRKCGEYPAVGSAVAGGGGGGYTFVKPSQVCSSAAPSTSSPSSLV